MSTIRDVHLYVLDTLADWEPGYTIAHINAPAPGVASRYRVRTVGADLRPVRTKGGITIVPDMALADLDPSQSAMLILPGADTWDEHGDALQRARQFVDAGVPIAAICGATFALARVGLLDDRKHTSNDPHWLASSGYAGGKHYVDAPAIEDRGVITASAMAPLDFARLVLARLQVFPEPALAAWYDLYTTRNPASYFAFMEAVGAA
jgi:putative intracellular protease/amidase